MRGSGVVAYSSGNHAQGVAHAARLHGTSSVIVMPSDAPKLKIDNTRALGAEVVLYDRWNEDREAMFELPRYVIKAGRVIVEDGEIREDTYGKSLHVAPEYDRDVEPDIKKWFEGSYSIQWRNYPVDKSCLHDPEVVA